jgi:hypothetical protein
MRVMLQPPRLIQDGRAFPAGNRIVTTDRRTEKMDSTLPVEHAIQGLDASRRKYRFHSTRGTTPPHAHCGTLRLVPEVQSIGNGGFPGDERLSSWTCSGVEVLQRGSK